MADGGVTGTRVSKLSLLRNQITNKKKTNFWGGGG